MMGGGPQGRFSGFGGEGMMGGGPQGSFSGFGGEGKMGGGPQGSFSGFGGEGMMGGGYLPDRLNRSTTDWIHRLNDVENHQWFRLGLAQLINGRLRALGRCGFPDFIGPH
jgi:hypothetical protein